MRQFPILFSREDLADSNLTPASFSSLTFRLLKEGRIKQIKRGLYALVDQSAGDIYASRFQIASKLFGDSYFSYHEALEYYGLSNQSFVSSFTYLSHFYSRELEFQQVVYRGKKSNCPIQINDFMKEEGIRVVSLERAIVDSIDCLSISGGLEEVEYALDNSPGLNFALVEQLLEYYDKSILYQKIGYLFEKHFGEQMPSCFYEKCKRHIGDKISYFDSRVGNARLNSKWKLMVKKEREVPDELF